MPTYVYGLPREAKALGCEHCRNTFEVVQPMSAEPLKNCPKCGAPVERRLCAPGIMRGGFSESSAAAAGFTQYKRKGKGYYEKTFGKGPKGIHRPPGS